MNMQILYGNDGVNYRILAKTSDTGDQVVGELGKGHFLSYDFTKKNYPDGAEPEALSFVTTTLNGTLGNKHILVSKSIRMNTFRTPCYMSHVHVMEIYDGMRSYTNESIYALCNMEFILPDKVEKYTSGNLQLEDFDGRNLKNVTVNEYNCGITDKAREAIICLLAGCDSNPGKVTIAVDAEEENYNKRVKEIILDIYTHMPYGWRSRFGFCSFITINSQSPDGVKLQFVESGTPSEGFQNFLDLNIFRDEYFEEQMKNVRTEYREYICEFLHKTKEERLIFFNQLSKDFSIDNGVNEYCEWSKNLIIWDNTIRKIRNDETADIKEQVLALIGSWINFIEGHSSEKFILLESLRNRIKKCINEDKEILLHLKDENNKYLKIYCKNVLDGDIKIVKKCRQILKRYSEFLTFIDCQYPVDNVEGFINEVLQKRDKIDSIDINKQKLDDLNKCIEDLCVLLGTIFDKSFYQEWLKVYIKKSEEEKDIEKKEECKKSEEKQSILQLFSQKRDYRKDYSEYFKKFSSLDPANQELFKQKAGEWLLNTEIDIFNRSYEEEEEWCKKYSAYIYEDYIQKYLEYLREKGYEEREKHWRNILLNNKLDYALEMLHGELVNGKIDIQKRAAKFLSIWFDENLKEHIKIEGENSDNIKRNLKQMNWFQYFAGSDKINEWIQIIDFKKYKYYKEWTSIKEVVLFMEYVKILDDRKPNERQKIKDMRYEEKKEEYILYNGDKKFNILMDLWDAKKLAEFFLDPKREDGLSLERNDFCTVLDSSLLGVYHWTQIFKKSCSDDVKGIIWKKYFLNDVLVPDTCVREIGQRIIDKKAKEAEFTRGFVTTEKKLQYERIISGRDLSGLEEYWQNWEKSTIIMPSALAALLQMFLIKAFSYEIGNIGLYSALLMTFAGIAFIVSIFIPGNNFFNRNQKIYKIIGGIMFLLLGWAVMGLNLLV